MESQHFHNLLKEIFIRKNVKCLAKHFEISEDLEDEDSIEMMHLSPKNLTHILLSKVFRRQMHHFNEIFIFHIFENIKVFCKVFCILSYKKISFNKLWKCWLSIKSGVQFIVVVSITEARYMTLVEAAKEVLWLTGLVNELGVEQGGVQLHCGSRNVTYLVKNQVYHVLVLQVSLKQL
jgi:hypothetical protein